MAQVNVRNRKKKDGSNNWQYYFEIASIEGKRKRMVKGGFATKKDALEAGTKALAQYNNGGTVTAPSEMSFSDFLDLYIDRYCRRELASNTVSGYEKKIRLYIKPALGNYKLCAITPLLLSDLMQAMKDKGLSRNTLVSIKAVLSGAFNYAVNPLQLLPSSPMVYVKIPKESEKQKKQSAVGGVRADGKNNGAVKGANSHVYIEKEWIDKIFERFPEDHVDHIPLLIGYRCGTRIGETYALCVEDFDLDAKTVVIDKQVQYDEKRKIWLIKEPKYNSVRTISIDDQLAQVIRKKKVQIAKDRLYYAEYYTRYFLDADGVINTEGRGKEIHFINVRENGTYINARTMQHCSHIIHHKLGFEEFDYHSFRHTHATDLAKAGANPKYVQGRLGHKSVKVTMEIYQHLDAVLEAQGDDVLKKMYI